MAAIYIGLSAGPFLGGLLTHHLGWRSIFGVNVFLGLIVVFLILWKLKGEEYGAEKETFDLTGSIIFSSTALLIMYGFSQLSTMWGVWLILLGALGIIVFVKWETRTESPVLNINLFKKNRVFAFSTLMAFTFFAILCGGGILASTARGNVR